MKTFNYLFFVAAAILMLFIPDTWFHKLLGIGMLYMMLGYFNSLIGKKW